MKILVCGGRDFADEGMVRAVLGRLLRPGDVVVHGAARGADSLAGKVAHEMGNEVRAYPANWRAHGRAGGAIRNAEMLDLERPEVVVAFPGGAGTRDMIGKATR
jgi:hypothetical protein